jgi:predicted nucleotidyltransferase/biotin operon repressor
MIEEILNSKPKVKILQLLTNRNEWIFSESEIARELQMPKATVYRAVKNLKDQNIITEFKKAGRVVLYRLNKSNYVVRELIEPILKKDYEIVTEKAKDFSRKIKTPVVVSIFGSAQRNDLKPTSDVDLGIITDNKKMVEKEVNEFKTKYLEKDGIIFSTHIFDKKEFKKRYHKKDPLIRDIANGKIISGNIDEVI